MPYARLLMSVLLITGLLMSAAGLLLAAPTAAIGGARLPGPSFAPGEMAVLVVHLPDSARTHAPRKHAGIGLSYAVLGTVIPIAGGSLLAEEGGSVTGIGTILIVSGYLFGPSMGNFYARDGRRGMIGAGLRLGGGLLFAGGLISALQVAFSDGSDNGAAEAMALGGLIVVSGATLWNLVTVPTSVREYNAQRPALVLSPSFDPQTRTAGLRLTYRF